MDFDPPQFNEVLILEDDHAAGRLYYNLALLHGRRPTWIQKVHSFDEQGLQGIQLRWNGSSSFSEQIVSFQWTEWRGKLAIVDGNIGCTIFGPDLLRFLVQFGACCITCASQPETNNLAFQAGAHAALKKAATSDDFRKAVEEARQNFMAA